MKKIAYLFDGQGAFKPGIGRELYKNYPSAKELIEKSSRVLGYDLTAHLWGESATNTANLTSIAQPAISVISLVYAKLLEEIDVNAGIALGHSLGEATAIVYCQALDFEQGIQMIKKRGELMEREGKQGTMMAVINTAYKDLDEICKAISKEINQPLVIANINAPAQIVISGSSAGIKIAAQKIAAIKGRGIPLNVGGAWHSPYLHKAADEFSAFLDNLTFKRPKHKFYSVVEQRVIDEPDQIKKSLQKQMLYHVDWVKAVNNVFGLGYDFFLEIGPSKILKDLVGKINDVIRSDSVALYTEFDKLSVGLE